jgi:hypothetical protein
MSAWAGNAGIVAALRGCPFTVTGPEAALPSARATLCALTAPRSGVP